MSYWQPSWPEEYMIWTTKWLGEDIVYSNLFHQPEVAEGYIGKVFTGVDSERTSTMWISNGDSEDLSVEED